MSTREQRRAARRNSELSTGPVTPEGKAQSRFNAMRHGLCSQQALLPGEDAQALQDLSREFHKSTKPVGVQELYCVERMILSYWRLRRIGALEAEILQTTYEEGRDKRLSLLIRYETSLQRTYDRASAELRNLQYMRGQTKEEPVAIEDEEKVRATPTISNDKSLIGFVPQLLGGPYPDLPMKEEKPAA
ncbi:MAG: hypothetical protein JWO48_2841 [Bryobacterales bacterium]|nr:hypothetical protein [Bryobacterales bacterium]